MFLFVDLILCWGLKRDGEVDKPEDENNGKCKEKSKEPVLQLGLSLN